MLLGVANLSLCTPKPYRTSIHLEILPGFHLLDSEMPSYPPFEDEAAGGGVPNYRMDPHFPILRGHMQTFDGDCLIYPAPQ